MFVVQLLKLERELPGQSVSDRERDAVLLWAYSTNYKILEHHNMEARTHALPTQYKLAPPLLSRFEKGLLYRFAPGRVCNARDLGREPVWRAVTTGLG